MSRMILSDIKSIGTAGGGTMGFGISFNFALAGYPVIIYDISDAILQKSALRMQKALNIFVTEGLVTQQIADATWQRITFTPELAALADCDFITEAIVESLPDKQELFRKLDALCQPTTIIASNTSSFRVSDIARDVKRQDKVVLTHYFDPPHIVPGMEVGRASGTSDETFELTYELMLKVKKVPVRVLKEIPGYLLNNIQGAMGAMARRLWAEGVASAEDIDLGVRASFGFRGPHEGPMMHYDLAGIFRWSPEYRARSAERAASAPGLSEEAKARIKEQLLSGKPWFVDPDHFEEAVEIRDREYARRLKDLYWGKMK
jgi:3-hydroxybutyryl-CoA dehydrogenase